MHSQARNTPDTVSASRRRKTRSKRSKEHDKKPGLLLGTAADLEPRAVCPRARELRRRRERILTMQSNKEPN
jgi:hypothetical protein